MIKVNVKVMVVMIMIIRLKTGRRLIWSSNVTMKGMVLVMVLVRMMITMIRLKTET